jgi:hypothetical protein
MTNDAFYDQVLATIVSMRAPFRSVEDREWKKLALMQNPAFPLPSTTTMRTRLGSRATEVEDRLLQDVVPGSKIAISLDGWSSTTRLSFMGIMAYYIDKDWVLREELIGFESLKDVHSGEVLARVVNKVFARYKLEGRIISITTDNAGSNYTMMSSINRCLADAFEKDYFLGGRIQHIPCLSHVIQLGLQALLGKIRLRPKNETFIRNWKADEELEDLEKITVAEARGIPYVLAKVRFCEFL